MSFFLPLGFPTSDLLHFKLYLKAYQHKMDKWEYISFTAGGSFWREHLDIYLFQEERLSLKENISSFKLSFSKINLFISTTFPIKDWPSKIKEYF